MAPGPTATCRAFSHRRLPAMRQNLLSRTTRRLAASPVLALALSVSLALPTAATNGPSPESAENTHCVSLIDRASNGVDSIIVESRCFATFAEGFEYGSRGAVQVAPKLQAADVTPNLVTSASASGSYLLGTYWDCLDYGGLFGCPNWSYWATGDCSNTFGWQVSFVGSTQNDRYESSKSYSNCLQNTHFEHSDFRGASLVCRPNCSNLGVMRNATSSLRWWGPAF